MEALAAPLFLRPGAAPAPEETPFDWRDLGCPDKLRLYVLSWLAAHDGFTAVANDPADDAVPAFLCLHLADGELLALAGDRYAADLEQYLLLGEHPIDSAALYQQALAQVRAGLTAAERNRFNPRAHEFHHRIHAAEDALIRHDGALYWLHNVNYPGLALLVQNSFYGFTEARLRELLDSRLDDLMSVFPGVFEQTLETVRPWLFR